MKALWSFLLILFFLVLNSFSFAEVNLIRSFEDSGFYEDGTVGFDGNFYYSVAMDSQRVLVGSGIDDLNGSFSGQARVFDVETGDLLHVLESPFQQSFGYFGSDLILDGDFALVAAWGEVDDSCDCRGLVHLYDTETGNHLRTFKDPTVGRNGRFGWSIAMSDDYVFIGEDVDSSQGLVNAGLVQMFDKYSGSLIRTFNPPEPFPNGNFGTSMAVDGNHIIIGARDPDLSVQSDGFSGRAFLFEIGSGELLRTIVDPIEAFDTHGRKVINQFGQEVAIQDDYLLVASGNFSGGTEGYASLFDAESGELLHTFYAPPEFVGEGEISGQFANSIDIEGDYIFIGQPDYESDLGIQGVTHIYSLDSYELLYSIKEPSAAGSLVFGNTIFAHENQIVIGAVANYPGDPDSHLTPQAFLYEISVPEPSSVCLVLLSCLSSITARRSAQHKKER